MVDDDPDDPGFLKLDVVGFIVGHYEGDPSGRQPAAPTAAVMECSTGRVVDVTHYVRDNHRELFLLGVYPEGVTPGEVAMAREYAKQREQEQRVYPVVCMSLAAALSGVAMGAGGTNHHGPA
jgi:hypothetical protein